MKLYDVSQLPVIEHDRLVGILDESDLLLAVAGAPERFNDCVREAMVTELTEIEVSAPVEDLIPIFDRDFVAIVMDGEQFLGLITRVDLLNYLRRKADR
jgi:cystathionine beta-synthase